MNGLNGIVLVCGGLCTVTGAVLIFLKDKIEDLLWLGITIQILGMVLIGMAARKPKPVDPTMPPKPPPSWFPFALFAILFLQIGFIFWWTKVGK
jgi:hypothetical protein